MKKWLSVILVVVLATVIAACGTKNDSSNNAASSPSSSPSASSSNSDTPVPDNSDLIKEGVGSDFGFGPVGHDLAGLVERMGDKAKDLKIGISVSTKTYDWMVGWVNALKGMCEENGIECIVADAQDKPMKQVEDLKNFENQGVDGILLFPAEEKSLYQVLEQLHGKIPVVPTIPMGEAKVAAYIDVDQQHKGKMGAMQLEESFAGEPGNILILDQAARVDYTVNRIKGFTDYVEQVPNLNIVETQAYSTREEYLKATINILSSREDVNAIYTPTGVSMVAAAQALKQLDRKDVRIVGVDGDAVILGLLQEGWITGTNPQSPQQNASIGLFTLLRIINGENVESPVYEPESYANLWATPENAEEMSLKLWGKPPVASE